MRTITLFLSGLILCSLTAFMEPAKDAGIVFPELDGFELLLDYPVYYPDNLWDYINGAADAYLEYGFVDLHIAEYITGDVRYKVEIYRHKDPTNGFGIYAQERSTDYQFIEMGAQGYREETLVHFVKGPYYVKVTTYNETDQSAKDLMIIAKSMEQLLDGPDSFPELLQAFPSAGKIENAEGFIAHNFMGYSFMSHVFTARYHQDDQEYTLFIIDTKDQDQAGKILESLSSRAVSAEEWAPGLHRIEDRYNGMLYFKMTSRVLIGAYGDIGPDLFKERTGQMKGL
jgi:hypothetical protein